jgi:hypothetical protein
VLVALDVSASMRPWFADGSAAAATDIVVGVAAAAGIRSVSAVLVGAEVTPVGADGSGTPTDGAGLADAVRQARPRWSAGARWSRLTAGARTIACVDFPTSAMPQGLPKIILSDDRRFDAAGARLPSPRPGHDASAELLAHPHILDRVTAALVRDLA